MQYYKVRTIIENPDSEGHAVIEQTVSAHNCVDARHVARFNIIKSMIQTVKPAVNPRYRSKACQS